MSDKIQKLHHTLMWFKEFRKARSSKLIIEINNRKQTS